MWTAFQVPKSLLNSAYHFVPLIDASLYVEVTDKNGNDFWFTNIQDCSIPSLSAIDVSTIAMTIDGQSSFNYIVSDSTDAD